MSDKSIITFRYRNHKGEQAVRMVRPIRLWFGSTAWHPDPQWMMEAFDLEKMETRDFALTGILGEIGRRCPNHPKGERCALEVGHEGGCKWGRGD